MSVSAGGSEAHAERERQIVFWHARAHDKLDEYGVPRFDDQVGELMLEERIIRLAENGPGEPISRGVNDA